MVQSFSVDEITKIRSKLKTSKSYPNDFLRQQNENRINENHNEEGDNSSSGVSSDQEIQTNGTPENKKQQTTVSPPQAHNNKTNVVTIPIIGSNNNKVPPPNPKPASTTTTTTPNQSLANKIAQLEQPKKVATMSATPVTTKVTTSIVSKMMPQQVAPALSQIKASKVELHKLPLQPQLSNEQRSDDENLSPSPPSLGFQRHNSLTRKQAAQLAAQRAKAMNSSARAVSLAQLPPPIEVDSDDPDNNAKAVTMPADQIVLAPPPEFCDFVSNPNQRVRIIGTIPKASRLHSQ